MSSSSSSSAIADHPNQTSFARRILFITIAIGAVIFIISLAAPKSSAPRYLQPGNGDFVKDLSPPSSTSSDNNKNKNTGDSPATNPPPPPKKKSGITFWTRGTGGRISPTLSKSIPSSSSPDQKNNINNGCSIRPSRADSQGWTIHCPCAFDDSNNSAGSAKILDFVVEFASPFMYVEETQCSHYLRSQFATAEIPSEDGKVKCGEGATSSVSVTPIGDQDVDNTGDETSSNPKTPPLLFQKLQIKISNLQKQKSQVCSSIKSDENSKNPYFFVTEVDFKLTTETQTDWTTCFASIGDWGRYQKNSIDAAALLERVLSVRPEVKFIVSTGDNFYPTGVKTVDDPQFKNVFERLYSGTYTRPLMWLQCLGNHDWWNKPDAQINYGKVRSDRWYFPSVTYGVTFPVPSSKSAKKSDDGNENGAGAGADFAMFYAIDSYGKIPMDAQLGKMDLFFQTGASKMKSRGSADKKFWKLVMGHRPVYSGATHGLQSNVIGDRPKFNNAFRKAHVNMYLNGDDHLLELHRLKWISENNSENQQQQELIDYFVTGAGGGSQAYASNLLDSTYLSFIGSVGFGLHCFGRNQIDPKTQQQFMRTEFHLALRSPGGDQGSAKDFPESQQKVPVVKTPLVY